MAGGGLRGGLARLGLLLLLTVALAAAAHAQAVDDLAALNDECVRLHQAGKYALSHYLDNKAGWPFSG